MSNVRIQGNASGTGTLTLQAPNTNTDRTLNIPDNAGNFLTTGSAGAIIQVVQATTTTQVVVNTTTYTDTTLSASITPTSSSNKVLVMIDQQFKIFRDVVSFGTGVRILRDSTVIWTPIENSNGPYSWYSDQIRVAYQHIQHSVLDSPSTTSSVTYKTKGRPHVTASNGQVTFQLSSSPANGISTITLMEVVA